MYIIKAIVSVFVGLLLTDANTQILSLVKL